MLRAVNVHQIAALGFILLAFNKNQKSYWTTIYFWLLVVATSLFPGIIYYTNLMNKGQKIFVSKFVPTGGLMHMVFWLLIGISFSSFKFDKK